MAKKGDFTWMARPDSKRSLARDQRRVDVLRLFHKGMSHTAIARELGINRMTVGADMRALFQGHWDDYVDRAKEMFAEVNMRYQAQLAAWWEKGLEEPEAAKIAQNILKELRALNGLDMPTSTSAPIPNEPLQVEVRHTGVVVQHHEGLQASEEPMNVIEGSGVVEEDGTGIAGLGAGIPLNSG